jgi:hypothetical protein
MLTEDQIGTILNSVALDGIEALVKMGFSAFARMGVAALAVVDDDGVVRTNYLLLSDLTKVVTEKPSNLTTREGGWFDRATLAIEQMIRGEDSRIGVTGNLKIGPVAIAFSSGMSDRDNYAAAKKSLEWFIGRGW